MRSAVAAGTAAIVLCLSPGVGGAAIDPGRGIAGMDVRMTAREIIEAKGKPDANRVVKFPGYHGRLIRYGKTKAFFSRPDYDRHPWQITTTSPAQRTSKGAGVGWTEERLRGAINRLHCGSPGGFRICTIGPIRRSAAAFYISKRTHRVTRVAIFRFRR